MKQRAVIAVFLVGCSSPDFEAGHREPHVPRMVPIGAPTATGGALVETAMIAVGGPPRTGDASWSCFARWTSTAMWRRYIAQRQENWCFCTAAEPDLQTDVRIVSAPPGDPSAARAAWWRSWRSDPRWDLKHVVQGPLCAQL